MTGRAYVFAGGGSGGHLFPGLAIAERIRAADPGARTVFLCSTRNIDARILRTAHVEFRPVAARPLSARPVALARLVLGWGGAVRACRRVIREARGAGGSPEAGSREVVVVAMGGFVSAPAVRAARAERVPVVLVNLDAIPGKANRWVARQADRVFTAARTEGAAGRGWERIPPIVRAQAVRPDGLDAGACRARLGLAPDRPTLLVLGGSQGARSINELMVGLVERHADALAGWQVVHQTGAGEEGAVRDAYGRGGVPARVEAFFEEMGVAWGAAECAVSRAGAGSVGEAWANGAPTVFAPYPFHRDQHQRANCAELVEAGGAVVGVDHVSFERNVGEADGVGALLLDLLVDGERRAAMRRAMDKLGAADGAEVVARELREHAAGD